MSPGSDEKIMQFTHFVQKVAVHRGLSGSWVVKSRKSALFIYRGGKKLR